MTKIINIFFLSYRFKIGKDSMKFYTNPNFFFELWRDAMLRQVEKEKNNKKPVQRPSNKMQNGLIADGKKPRQPANSNERYRKMVSQQEFLIGDDLPNRNVIYMSNNEAHSYDQYDTIQRQNQMDVYGTYNSNQINQQQQQMQPHYAYHNGNQNINNNESNAAYYGTIKNGVDYVDNNLIQNNINNNCAKHSNYLSNHNNNGMSHHHLQQINGNHQINNSITPPPSYQAMNQFNQFNSQQQQDQYNQQMQQQNQMQTLNRRTSRPSQPPPQPPQPLNGHPIEYHQTNGFINHYNSQQHTNLNSSNSSNNNNELVNTKLRPQSLSRDVLGLPPPVPNIHHQMNNTNDNHHHHNLPPPMPINLNGKLVSPANLQQSINNQTSNIAPLVNIPPPPPMPTNLLNNNGSSNNKQSDVTDNAKSNSNNSSINSSSNTTRPLTIPAIKQTTFEQEILQKQKQLQPVKNIKRPPPKSDPRNDLLASIREGIKLRRVEDSKQKEVEKNENLLDVASILARRVAMELSDSDTNDSNNSDNDDDWVDESNV